MDAQWQRCVEAFLDSIEDISGSVRSRARYAYILHAFFTDEERNPDTYTQTEVQSFLNATSTSPRNPGRAISPNTKNNRLMVLRSFFAFAATFEVDGSPILKTLPPTSSFKYVKIGAHPLYMTEDEITRFFESIDTSTVKGVRDMAIFTVYFLTAKRRSEISNLKVGDIQEVYMTDEQGNHRQFHTFQYHAKGHSRSISLAELPSIAYNAIVRYWRESGRIDILTPTSPVFASTRPDQPEQQLTADYMNALCKYYLKRAKLNPRYSLHSLRHSSARQRYELGSDIRAIQETLNHSSLSTTSLYLKSLVATRDTGADLLTKRFGHLWKL